MTLAEKLTCDCGSVFVRGNKVHHEKTKKHLLYIDLMKQKDDLLNGTNTKLYETTEQLRARIENIEQYLGKVVHNELELLKVENQNQVKTMKVIVQMLTELGNRFGACDFNSGSIEGDFDYMGSDDDEYDD
jgi:sulfate adenylyltransferase subunit 1 (EFTu-like GTPase family)